MKPTLHVIGLPHTIPTPEFSWCAYTQKTRRFIEMMKSNGYEVNAIWGRDMKGFMPEFTPDDPHFRGMALRAAAEIYPVANPGDYLCLAGGLVQKYVADALPHLTAVEHGIGYTGIFTKFCCFETYAWMAAVYSTIMGGAHAVDGRNYDVVIPNSFGVDEFPLGTGTGGYLLYAGRLIKRKGILVAAAISHATGIPLKVAGQGAKKVEPGKITCEDGTVMEAAGIEYMGTLKTAQVAEAMGNAIATIVPTEYLEPFGGVGAESQLCGTPVLSTDWGAFPETVIQGVTGFRCRMLQEFVDGVEACKKLDRQVIRQHAIDRFSTDVCAKKYADWFERLETLKGDGWYTRRAG
jgi:glycosyltransferase involved in cell wall biosynthesis